MLNRIKEKKLQPYYLNKNYPIKLKNKIYAHPDGDIITLSYEGLIEKINLDNPTLNQKKTLLCPSHLELLDIFILENGHIVICHDLTTTKIFNAKLEMIQEVDLHFTKIIQLSPSQLIGSALENVTFSNPREQFYLIDPASFDFKKINLTADVTLKMWGAYSPSHLVFIQRDILCFNLKDNSMDVIELRKHYKKPIEKLFCFPEIGIIICGDDYSGIIINRDKHLVFHDQVCWNPVLLPDKKSLLISGDSMYKFEVESFSLTAFNLEIESQQSVYHHSALTSKNKIALMNGSRISIVSTTPNFQEIKAESKAESAMQCVRVNNLYKPKIPGLSLGTIYMTRHSSLLPLEGDLIACVAQEKPYDPQYVKIINIKTMEVVKTLDHVFSSDIRLLKRGSDLVTCDGSRLQQWDIKTGLCKDIAHLKIKGFYQYIDDIYFISENEFITFDTNMKSVKLWTLDSQNPTYKVLFEMPDSFNTFFGSDSHVIFNSAKTFIYNIKKKEITSPENRLSHTFAASNTTIAMNSTDKEISFWDFEVKECRRRVAVESNILKISALGSILFCAILNDQQIIFMNPNLEKSILLKINLDYTINYLNFDLDTNRLYGRSETHLFVFDLMKMSELKPFLDKKLTAIEWCSYFSPSEKKPDVIKRLEFKI